MPNPRHNPCLPHQTHAYDPVSMTWRCVDNAPDCGPFMSSARPPLMSSAGPPPMSSAPPPPPPPPITCAVGQHPEWDCAGNRWICVERPSAISCAVGQHPEWDEARGEWICVQDELVSALPPQCPPGKCAVQLADGSWCCVDEPSPVPDLSLDIEPDCREEPTIVLYKNGTWKFL